MIRRIVFFAGTVLVLVTCFLHEQAKSDCNFQAELTGCVVDGAGDPVAGAMVCLQPICDPPCMIEPWFCGLCDTTDATGCFTLSRFCVIPFQESFPTDFCISVYSAGYVIAHECIYIDYFAPCLDSIGADTMVMPLDFGMIVLLPDTLDKGDVNGSGSVDAADVFYLIDYAYRAGPPPVGGLATGDVNCDGTISLIDIVRLVGYVFRGGPPLNCL